MKSLGSLKIKVEAKIKSKIISKCRRCRRFAHTANYCTATWVCAFCAQNHITTTCPNKDKSGASPRCANCSGAHFATYRGCPKVPKSVAVTPNVSSGTKSSIPLPPPKPLIPLKPAFLHPNKPSVPAVPTRTYSEALKPRGLSNITKNIQPQTNMTPPRMTPIPCMTPSPCILPQISGTSTRDVLLYILNLLNTVLESRNNDIFSN